MVRVQNTKVGTMTRRCMGIYGNKQKEPSSRYCSSELSESADVIVCLYISACGRGRGRGRGDSREVGGWGGGEGWG